MDSPPNPLVLSGLRSLLYTFADGVTFTVPIFLHKAFSVLEAHYLTTEGIFRKPGIASKLRVLKNCFNASSALELNFKIEEVSPFDLCDLIKLFLREIDEPILTWGLQPQFLQFADLNTPRDVRTKCLLQLCHALPPRHKETLAFIMRFLKMISNSSAYNKMDVKNLATVFVPCIFRESAKARPVKHGQALLDELAASKNDIALKVDVLEMLIQNADSIGVLSEQERAILAAESSDKLNDDLNILKRSAKKAASKVLVRSRNSLSGNRNSQIYRRSVQPKLKSAESIERHERIKGSRITEPYKRRSVCSLEKSQGLSDKGENGIIRQNRCLEEKHVKPMRSSMFETMMYSSAFTEGVAATSGAVEEQCTTSSPIVRTSSLPDRKVISISTENRESVKVNKAESELVRAEPVQTVLRGTTVQFMSSDNELQDAYGKQSCLYEELSSALDNFAKTINVGAMKSPVERMEVCTEEEKKKKNADDGKEKEARLPRCISAPVESVPQVGGTFAKKRNTSLGASKLRRGMPNSLKSGLREPKTPFSSPLKSQQQANMMRSSSSSSNNLDKKNNMVVVGVDQREQNLEIESKENIIQPTKPSSINMDIVEDDEFKDSDTKKQIILQQINPDDDPASAVGFCIRPSVNFIREHRKGHVRSKIQEFTDRESRLEFVGEEADSSSVIGQSPAEVSKRVTATATTTTSKPTATRKPSSTSGNNNNKGCSLNIKFSACF